ncbi:MAG: hypothetical protein V1770_02330 [bacterium]
MDTKNNRKLQVVKEGLILEAPKKEISQPVEVDWLEVARQAAKDACQKRIAAEQLYARAVKIRQALSTLAGLTFLKGEGRQAESHLAAEFAEIEANEDYQVLVAEIKAKAEAEAKAKAEAEAEAKAKAEAKDKAEAEARDKARAWDQAQAEQRKLLAEARAAEARDRAKAKAAAEREKALAQKIASSEVMNWARKGGHATLVIFTKWHGANLPAAGVRLAREINGTNVILKVSSVKGEAPRDMTAGKATWTINTLSKNPLYGVPTVFRKGIILKGWDKIPAAPQPVPAAEAAPAAKEA